VTRSNLTRMQWRGIGGVSCAVLVCASGAAAQQYANPYPQGYGSYPPPQYYIQQPQPQYQQPYQPQPQQYQQPQYQQPAYHEIRQLPPVQPQTAPVGMVVGSPPPLQQVAPGQVYPAAPRPQPINPRQPVPQNYYAVSDTYEASRAMRDVRPNWYVGLNMQFVQLDDAEATRANTTQRVTELTEFNPGFAGGLVAGYQWSDYLRSEIELGYGRSDADGSEQQLVINGEVVDTQPGNPEADVQYWRFMANQYVDLPVPGYESFIPYLGAGLGYVQQTSGEADGDLAYQGMAGVAYSPAPRIAFNLGYRYLNAGELLGSEGFESDLEAHSAELGLRYYFGD